MDESVDDRLWRFGFAAIILADIAILLTVASHPLPIVDNLSMPDDAYLSLGVARNIALGKGPWQGLGFTNGFQPLYVFLMVPVFRVWQTDLMTPIRVALVMLSLFNVATLAMLLPWLRRMTGSTTAALVAGVAWPFDWYTIYQTLGGLETAISVCFVVACLATFHRVADGSESKLLTRLGVLLGFAVFARIDNLLLVAALGGVLIVRQLRADNDPEAVGRLVLRVGLPIVLVNLPWWIYSHHYTGAFYPVSGEAVRFRSLAHVGHAPTWDNQYWPMITRGARDIFRANTELLIATVVVALIGLVRGWLSRKLETPRWTLSAMSLWAAMLFAAYTGYIFAPWYFGRYLYPLIVPILVLLAFSVRAALCDSSVSARACAILTVVVLVGALGYRKQFRNAFTSTITDAYGYMNVGLWAHDRFPPDTRIGAVQSGALGYFAPELVVVNLDGVVNKECFKALRESRAMDYVQQTGLQFVVGWESDKSFLLGHSRPGAEAALDDLGPIPGFRSFNQPWRLYKVQ